MSHQNTLESCEVLSVNHWNESVFSFTIKRPPSFHFKSGQFTMIGLPDENGKPVLRAYSLVSPPWEDHLEFLSIKMPDGPLTSKLQHIVPGDKVLLKSLRTDNDKFQTGTLTNDHLTKGKNLFLMGTGTGLAPWMSLIRDAETYKQYDHVYVCHGVREVKDLAYRDYLEKGIFEDEMVEAALEHDGVEGGIKGRLTYYPTVTREPFRNEGRLTDLIKSGKLFADLGLNQTRFSPETDRVMVCGSTEMNKEIEDICESQGLQEGSHREAGAFVIERAFAPKKTTPAPQVTSVTAEPRSAPGKIKGH